MEALDFVDLPRKGHRRHQHYLAAVCAAAAVVVAVGAAVVAVAPVFVVVVQARGQFVSEALPFVLVDGASVQIVVDGRCYCC